MKRSTFISSLLGVAILATACGTEKRETSPSVIDLHTDDSASSIRERTVGPCAVIGNIRDFQINCTKAIHRISLHTLHGFHLSGGGVTVNSRRGSLNFSEFSPTFNIELQSVDPRHFPDRKLHFDDRFHLRLHGTHTSLAGSESLASSLDIAIDFTDSQSIRVPLED
jgi:hypothetical protein